MAFTCPLCKTAGSLVITHSIELPAELSWGDELSVQVLACGACRYRGVAVYEESRRGATERVHHRGFSLTAAEADELVAVIERCPARGDARCDCATHRVMSNRDVEGRWLPPIRFASESAFPIRFSSQ